MKENINKILNELPKGSKLIAVSKTKPVEMIMKAYEIGIRDFGENKVQELIEKIDKLPKDIRWHMIGHLQTNKVNKIIGRVYMIHSVDSIKLAKEISKQSIKKNVITNILIEINIANEDSKYGFKVNELKDAVKETQNLKNINLCGLMCVAPYTKNPEANRKYFKLINDLKEKYNLDIISAGMSNDYKIALEEGSNYIRVGTKIFGERNYQKKDQTDL